MSTAAKSAAGLLGIDPLYLACEGRAVMIVPENRAEGVLSTLRGHRQGRRAAIVGRADKAPAGPASFFSGPKAAVCACLSP